MAIDHKEVRVSTTASSSSSPGGTARRSGGNRYRADLREFEFLLFEQFQLAELLGKPPFDQWGPDEVRSAISECYRWVKEVIGPLCASGDEEGCRVENGQVKTPTGFKEAWQKLCQAGWKSVGVDPEFGGGGAPHTLQVLIEELISGANTAFAMYPGLASGAAEVIHAFGTPEQKALYCERMFSGQWGGTMCLTEPQAGSDVGSARTTASKNPDGSYSIRGTKIFISAGDHDLTDNIIHLVLARVDGAPAGTKGLTLFIVPKYRVNPDGSRGEPNDVNLGSIEHKMGINASSTCVLNFGENGACKGWPVGGESKLNQGMPQMFQLMNTARIAVGVQGTSVASSAYLNALDYARERKQGATITEWKNPNAPRVSIIEHADVRRMLLDMKARVEGVRALIIKLARHSDAVRVLRQSAQGSPADGGAAAAVEEQIAYHQGQVDLLVPLVKAYGSDQAFRVCELAIQTYGGAGYTKDYPVEQYCRDSKIFSIYEGTNHIQAMDLVGRKLPQHGGANLQRFLGDVAQFVAQNGDHPELGKEVKALGMAQEAMAGSAMRLLMWFQSGNIGLVPLYANRFLEMMSEVAVCWLLLDGARLAIEKSKGLPENHADRAFYAGKVHAARYYARTVLGAVELKARQMQEEDRSPLEIADDSFATI